jgi:Ca2+-binding EF-hand superfamily protein
MTQNENSKHNIIKRLNFSILKIKGLFPTEQELQQMLNDIDIDGDGTFSFDEFVQLMYNMGGLSEISEEQEELELRDAFKVYISF